ncbi:hypothetical protein [Microlunatus flavus]|uniref:Uncharacterized protein n=1 Tax=Microlunatus flavus TaxID=1036181 RepID=A0A1H9HBK5_9ACTN|nr:hypothetical protein [Microlunatus flavus]SEQ59731.1 hypothetical protein SAMN05421756_104186 [Microlunatus flavus]
MTTTSPTPTRSATRPAGGLVTALRVFAALAAVVVLWQFVTAGQLLPRGSEGAETGHAAGAIVLHVVSGLAAIAAVVLWRQGVVSLGLAALAAVVFAFGFLQAALGGYDSLYVHIPGAMLLTTGVVWLLVAVVRLRRV